MNDLSRRYTIWGVLCGLVFPGIATLIESSALGLGLKPLSIWTVQRDQPLLWIIDTVPLILGFVAGLLGQQQSLRRIVEYGKKEWELIFDSFSDLIFITDTVGKIVRCNYAVIDRLNTRYVNIIGKLISEILAPDNTDEANDAT